MPQTLTNVKPVTLEKLWQAQPVSLGALPPGDAPFDPEALTALPLLARRYLRWAIVRDWPKGANVPGTPIVSAVRLQMHGTIKLGNKWHRFTGEEVIRWQRGMIWRATTWMQGLPIFGADRLVDGVCDVRWKLLGLLPVMQASGEDVTRSAAGRIQGEAVWLPSVLCHPEVVWTELNDSQLQADFTAFGEPAHLTLTLDAQGAIQQVAVQRWGQPEGGDYHYPLALSPRPAALLRATPFPPKFEPGGSLAATGLRARVNFFAAPSTEPAIASQNFSTQRHFHG